MRVKIAGCGRCGDTHEDIEANPFTYVPGNTLMFGQPITHFAICPETQEPILIQVNEE
jgi:hypothetical protein